MNKLTLDFGQTATVISENANLRGTPSEMGKVVDTLPQDSQIEIIKQKGPLFLVQSEEFVGWLHGNTIRLNGASTIPKIKTVTFFNFLIHYCKNSSFL